MATETERKFLVTGEFRDNAVKKLDIIQCYLSVDPEKTIRIRISDKDAYITIKSPHRTGSFSRGEWEYKIPFQDAIDLMELCVPGKVVKTRYIIPSGKHKIEVDEFHDKNEGLIFAEIELTEEDEEFIKPEWLGKEVTGDPKYFNSNLIK
jgi:adenylate cyclase